MTGFRSTASHEIINHQFDQLGEHYEQLGALIGPQAAIETVIAADTYTQVRAFVKKGA